LLSSQGTTGGGVFSNLHKRRSAWLVLSKAEDAEVVISVVPATDTHGHGADYTNLWERVIEAFVVELTLQWLVSELRPIQTHKFNL